MPELIPQLVSDTQPLLPVEQEGPIDSSSQYGERISDVGIKIRYETFEHAQEASKGLSDSFVDGAIEDGLSVGGRWVGIKGYLDTVEATSSDREISTNPERIAGLYLRTTEMLARNLKIAVIRNGNPEQANARREQVKQSKEKYLTQLAQEAPDAADEIAKWCRGDVKRFPLGAVEYHGFKVDNRDILDADNKGFPDIMPNFKIQRQLGGVFVMAYSDRRVQNKFTNKEGVLSRRIYLNPDIEAAPEIFEQLLQSANEAGIPLQLKMFQRAPELATLYKSRTRGKDTELGGLRGDGIVMYAEDEDANEVLEMVLALAKDNPDSFKGRSVSRVPQSVAEGIAVGDEPVRAKGASLTSHREKIFSYAADKTRESDKKGEDARQLYRDLVKQVALDNGVNPNNIAFNNLGV